MCKRTKQFYKVKVRKTELAENDTDYQVKGSCSLRRCQTPGNILFSVDYLFSQLELPAFFLSSGDSGWSVTVPVLIWLK